MKRKFVFAAALMMVLLAVLAGCGNTGLADYKRAAEKTDDITKGQNSAEFSLALDFNTEGLSRETINELNYYTNLSGSFRSAFDRSREEGIYRSYLNLGGLGFDFEIYHNGDEMFAKLPIVGKYMSMDNLAREADQTAEGRSQIISDDTLEALSAEWVGMLKKEDVFKGKDMVLTTPDGEVRTTIYTITLNDSQVKAFEEKAVSILSGDENLRSYLKSVIEKKEGKPATFDFDKFIGKIIEQVRKDTVESFQYTAYVDIDGYIVNETIEVRIRREAPEKGEPESISFHLDMKNWDINKDQKLEFPVLTEENTIDSNNFGQTMPSLFTDLFRTQ